MDIIVGCNVQLTEMKEFQWKFKTEIAKFQKQWTARYCRQIKISS